MQDSKLRNRPILFSNGSRDGYPDSRGIAFGNSYGDILISPAGAGPHTDFAIAGLKSGSGVPDTMSSNTFFSVVSAM